MKTLKYVARDTEKLKLCLILLEFLAVSVINRFRPETCRYDFEEFTRFVICEINGHSLPVVKVKVKAVVTRVLQLERILALCLITPVFDLLLHRGAVHQVS